MKEMTKNISIITNCEIKYIEKTGEQYNVISDGVNYNNFDIIVFSNIVNNDWNGLTREIVNAPTINSFKAAYDRLHNSRDY